MIDNYTPPAIVTASYRCPTHGEYTANAERGYGACTRCLDAAKASDAALSKRRKRHDRWAAAGIPSRYLASTLASWQPQDAAQRRAATLLAKWTEDLEARYDDGRGLLLLGPPGVGKTHLLVSLLRGVIEQGGKGVYVSWADWFAAQKARWARKANAEAADAIERLKAIPFLALDELALSPTRTDTEFTLLHELLDSRYADELPTLAASNAPSLDALGALIGERAADRLRDCTTALVIAGKSMRGRQRPAEGQSWPEPPAFDLVPVCERGVLRAYRVHGEIDSRRSIHDGPQRTDDEFDPIAPGRAA